MVEENCNERALAVDRVVTEENGNERVWVVDQVVIEENWNESKGGGSGGDGGKL